jgi:hypothetical protein
MEGERRCYATAVVNEMEKKEEEKEENPKDWLVAVKGRDAKRRECCITPKTRVKKETFLLGHEILKKESLTREQKKREQREKRVGFSVLTTSFPTEAPEYSICY